MLYVFYLNKNKPKKYLLLRVFPAQGKKEFQPNQLETYIFIRAPFLKNFAKLENVSNRTTRRLREFENFPICWEMTVLSFLS